MNRSSVSKLKEFDGGLALNHAFITNQPIVIGIDQSYSGFAVTALSATGEPAYYTWVFKPDGTGILRLAAIQEFLESLLFDLMQAGYQIEATCMEGYAFGAQMAHMAGELGGAVKMALLRSFHTPAARYPLIVPPANLKKYVTGKGTGVQKNQMLLNIYKKWEIEFTDDNAADSYALARLVSGRADNAYEKEVWTKLQDPKFREGH
jgi:hypothetical protein